MTISLNLIAAGLRPSGTITGKVMFSVWALPQAGCTVHLRGFIGPHVSLAVWDLEVVTFFSPVTLQISGLLLFSFIPAYRPANSLLSSSSYNNSLVKAANENQHTLQIVCFLGFL